ncbi:unnamed protein product [Rhizophagus irregularis]|nr:unnamed protein product [Rhizophagus irregularis]
MLYDDHSVSLKICLPTTLFIHIFLIIRFIHIHEIRPLKKILTNLAYVILMLTMLTTEKLSNVNESIIDPIKNVDPCFMFHKQIVETQSLSQKIRKIFG